MPVIHDVDAFSGEWHHKPHKELSMECLPSSFVACVCYVMKCEVDKRSRALALL
jgi:hypothetical protein